MEEAEKLVQRLMSRGFDLNLAARLHDQETPLVSLEWYIFQKRRDLCDRFSKRIKVYLDTKYWVILRDTVLGRRQDEASTRLLQILERLVSERKIVCPISSTGLFEILRQHDARTRTTTAQLIDSLSAGLSLRSDYDRATEDLVRVMLSIGKERKSFERIDFDHISHVLGFLPFAFETFEVSLASPLSYSKASFDMGEYNTLEDIIPGFNPDSPQTLEKLSSRQDWADTMNAYKAKYKNKSYSEILRDEFLGGLKTSLKRLESAMQLVYLLQHCKNPSLDEIASSSGGLDQIKGGFYQLFESGKFETKRLPQIHIQAAIFAKIISERNRKITKTDLDDVMHASDALPSCKLFLTENSLAHLLNNPPTNLAKEFKVTVVSRIEDAITELEKIP